MLSTLVSALNSYVTDIGLAGLNHKQQINSPTDVEPGHCQHRPLPANGSHQGE